MREIFSRGKRIDNCKFVYGYYSMRQDIFDGEEVEIHSIQDLKGTPYLIDLETLGRYTGIEDKNKTRIFEGDNTIIRDEPDEIWTVKWDNDELQWALESETVCIALGSYYSYELEVIGNIHDGKEDEN